MPTFSNQAQLSYNGITANSNIAYGQPKADGGNQKHHSITQVRQKVERGTV